MIQLIENLQELLNNNLFHINQYLFVRKNKISFKDVFYYLTQLIHNKLASSITVSSNMHIQNICTATAKAFIKKRNLVPYYFLEMLSADLLDYSYTINNRLLFNKYRILATDGTHMPLSKELIKDDYKLTKNKLYINGCCNGIYDIYNNIIVDLNLDKCNSEQKIYQDQLHYLQKDDIIIHDRGYYSHKLLYLLYSKNIYPIFRMKKNMKIVQDLLNSVVDDKIYIINNDDTNYISIKYRLVKYEINNKIYILGTTLLDGKFTIDLLKELYKHRWKIEVYFKTIKYDLSFQNFHSKSEELVKQEIQTHKCITQLTKILEKIYIYNNKHVENKMQNNNTNLKNNLDKTIKNILKILLYKKNNKEIRRILILLFTYLVEIRENRSYKRKAIVPPSKWYHYGDNIT
jgi:hypothetical protein